MIDLFSKDNISSNNPDIVSGTVKKQNIFIKISVAIAIFIVVSYFSYSYIKQSPSSIINDQYSTITESDSLVDSDSDGLVDSDEINIYHTDPNNADSDYDGYLDGEEVKAGYDPLDTLFTSNDKEKYPFIDISPRDNIRGNLRTAELVILEYGDLSSPFSKRFHSVIKQIVDEYDGKVAWAFRHFPIWLKNQGGQREAEAAKCVEEFSENDVFWDYIDELFVQQDNPNKNFSAIAEKFGVERSDFNNCFNTGQFTDAVYKERREAINSGGSGSPYSLLVDRNGNVTEIRGYRDINDMRQIIEDVLNSEQLFVKEKELDTGVSLGTSNDNNTNINVSNSHYEGYNFTLTGRVTDAKTGDPVSGVSVVVAQSSNHARASNGYYSLEFSPTYEGKEIEVYVPYSDNYTASETKTVIVGEVKELNFTVNSKK